jgi:SMI1/KNR4 family protein SUKH-1
MKLVPPPPLDPELEPVAHLLRRWKTEISRATGESRTQLADAERASGLEFPRDYLALMSLVDGGDALLEPEGSLVLWPAGELLEANAQVQAKKFFPGLFLIGSDGGGEAVALRRSGDGRVEFVLTPFIGNPATDALPAGRTLEEFLDRCGSGAIWKHRAGRSRD